MARSSCLGCARPVLRSARARPGPEAGRRQRGGRKGGARGGRGWRGALPQGPGLRESRCWRLRQLQDSAYAAARNSHSGTAPGDADAQITQRPGWRAPHLKHREPSGGEQQVEWTGRLGAPPGPRGLGRCRFSALPVLGYTEALGQRAGT